MQVHEYSSMRHLHTLRGHTMELTQMALSRDDRYALNCTCMFREAVRQEKCVQVKACASLVLNAALLCPVPGLCSSQDSAFLLCARVCLCLRRLAACLLACCEGCLASSLVWDGSEVKDQRSLSCLARLLISTAHSHPSPRHVPQHFTSCIGLETRF